MFHRFWTKFRRISGGFWEVVSMIFRIFFENADLQNSCAHAVFRKGRAFENQWKNTKKSMPNRYKFWTWKKRPQNMLKSGFGRVLGSIWEGFGTLWGVFWPLLGDFCSFFWRSKWCFFQAWVQDGLQDTLWINFGRVLEGFGEDLGKVWEGILEDLDVFA